MESTRDIKGRIRSVTNIQQITKAMKMVAAARLRKAEEKAHGAGPYAAKVEELLRYASAASPEFSSPLFQRRESGRRGFLVISGDKGLAGAYNSNVMKEAAAHADRMDPDSYRMYLCGKQARNYLKFRGYSIASYHFGFSDKPQSVHAHMMAQEMIEHFLKGEVDEIHIIYTKFYTALRQQVTMTQLLPIVPPETVGSEAQQEFMFLPDAEAVFSKLLPEYVEVQIYNAMLQSAASELGSRMAAMTAATDNATERIADLTLSYNKARQAQVTNEISEIVGGVNALQ